jgi:hypothetical protein
MRRLRIAAAAVAGATLVAAAAGPTVAAGAPGVGTAGTATSVLRVDLGGGALLALRVLGDDSRATIDPKVAGAPASFVRLAPLDVTAAAAGLAQSLPGLEARSPEGPGEAGAPGVSLSTPVTSGGLDAVSLRASTGPASASASLGSGAADLSVAGGLVRLQGAVNTLGADSVDASASSKRGLRVDRLTVLDLGALLDGLGLSLADLPVQVVSDLLGALGLQLPGLAPGTTLAQAVGTLNGAIDEVQALIASAGSTIDSTVAGTVGGLIDQVGGVLGGAGGGSLPPVPTVGSAVSTLNDTLDGLQQQLAALLSQALGLLDGAALLSVDGLEVGIDTKATPDPATSFARITAGVRSVSVGGTALPGVVGVDPSAAADQLAALVNGAVAKVSSVLGTIHPSLANVVSLRLFDRSAGVTTDGGYVRATAGLTALTATVTPPADLAAVVAAVTSQVGIGDMLGSLGAGSLQALPASPMSALEQALGGGVQALASGATVRVGEVTASSEFAGTAGTARTAAPAAELPRTGGDGAPFAVAGVLALAAAVAIIRWLRRPVIT